MSGSMIMISGPQGWGPFGRTWAYGAQFSIEFLHDDAKFRTPSCECCCCGIGFVQSILEWTYWWDGLHRTSRRFDTYGSGILYPEYQSANPCEPRKSGNWAKMFDAPSINYNFVQKQLHGHPRFLHMKGVACAVCTQGKESYELEHTERFGVNLTSLTIYGCMEWEFSLDWYGFSSKKPPAFSKRMQEISCQHARFLGEVLAPFPPTGSVGP
jgi:hypothetical protein